MITTRTHPASAFALHLQASLLGVALLCALPWSGMAAAHQDAEPMRKEALAIRDASGRCHRFRVEVAASTEQRMRGLSHRRTLAENAGMLFDFGGHGATATMWMKDTYLPLDMLFIRDDGRIARIERETQPHSTEHISAGTTVRAVLEINGGLSGRLGLAVGDRVVHPMFPGAARYCVED